MVAGGRLPFEQASSFAHSVQTASDVSDTFSGQGDRRTEADNLLSVLSKMTQRTKRCLLEGGTGRCIIARPFTLFLWHHPFAATGHLWSLGEG